MKKLFTLFFILISITSLNASNFKQNNFRNNDNKNKIKKNEIKNIYSKSILSFENLEQESVKKKIKIYEKKSSRKILNQTLKRSELYINYIYKSVEKENMPPEIVYLPLIESNYKINATSKSGAKGLWQFMTNSIKGYGIEISEWTDDRKDFIKTTDAAMKKLKYNYSKTGDWLLAIAAYNCGLGRVTRTVKSSGISDFWILAEKKLLPKETIEYIPKLIAVSYICSNKRKYNLYVNWSNTQKWRTISLKNPIDLRILSKKTEIPLYKLKQGNAELKHFITPPSKNYKLKIQEEYYEIVKKTIDNQEFSLIKFDIYIIKKGDTLYALSKHYKIDIKNILKYNKNINPQNLKLGQKILIPNLKNVTPYIAKSKKSNITNEEFKNSYIVQKGDTLWSIAKKFNTNIESLIHFNNIKESDILPLGFVLKIP